MRTHTNRVALALVAAALLVAGATSAQPRQPPPPETPAAAPSSPPKIEVDDPLLVPVPAAPRLLASWRDALVMISARSTELRIATQEIERAEGLSRQALGRALPQVTASGVVRHHLLRTEVDTLDPITLQPTRETAPTSPTAIAELTVSQPVLAPRAWYAIGTSRRTVRSAKLRVEDQRRLILGAVANAIVAVVTAERLSEINRVGLRSALERLELMRRRLRLESGTKLDVLRAEQDATLARGEVISADESLRQAREALGLALGSSEPHGVPPTIRLDELEKSAREICTPARPDGRADVVAARSELEIAERGVTDAKLAYAPTAEVSTTLSYSSELQANRKHYGWVIQGVLSIPIWDGGSRYGESRAARAGVEQSKERVEAARRTATLESSQALRGIGVADQARVLAERGRDLARETSRLSQVAFDAGSSTSFELVEAAQRQREAELNLVVREFDLVKARITALLSSASCSY